MGASAQRRGMMQEPWFNRMYRETGRPVRPALPACEKCGRTYTARPDEEKREDGGRCEQCRGGGACGVH